MEHAIWPENVANAAYYGADGRGTNENSVARLMNTYMEVTRRSFFHSSGKVVRYVRGLAPKAAVDVARLAAWRC